ncbi:tetratricopeptide [Amylocarpus encephaloides]|uniref:Tetratricopeptide n=1 Tax=Amylocarpus encephaloides TaxID=45428 RepID=A0A9P7YD20_9HELO|nr:tetratricopeptide [Amylocarpus encephaloides]
MASHHPSPPAGMQMIHGPPSGPPAGPPAGPPPPNMAGPPQQQQPQQYQPPVQQVTLNEVVWLQIGSCFEVLGNLESAIESYEQALRLNPRSIAAMNAISCILRAQEQFHKAVEYLQNILKLDGNNGDVWGSLGHCYLMMDDLQQAYSAYQQALYHLRDPKASDRALPPCLPALANKAQEPKLWYGIGILYDRYGSLEHAEEAFSQVMRMQPDFEKANEIYFRLGIIYKQQQKYQQSLECFRYIISVPPTPLTEEDIWFQIGHVHEQQKDYDNAKAAYMRVVDRDPNHAKVLQQLGWLHHQQSNSFASQERAIEYLEKSVGSDQSDAQSWYLLGRCYMSQQKYPKAYEAYQQAVYRDGRNPTFWCSIGVLYYQINQYRDALDAYSRAIRLNPYISEVWYDLGTLYESCNNQINDALDAYQRAAELDPTNNHIKARLQLLRNGQTNGLSVQSSAPLPQDVHPQAYQASGAVGPPGPQWGNSAPQAPAAQGPLNNVNGGWGSRLAEINPPPQPANPYDQREPARGPGGPIPPLARGPSPRQEQQQLRPYPGPGPGADRGPPIPGPSLGGPPGPPPLSRRSPPRDHHPAMGPYPGPGQGIPPSQAPPQAPPQSQVPPSQTQRVPNPIYAGSGGGGGPGSSNVLPPAPSHLNGSGPAAPLPPFGRGGSPRTDVRPILENNRMPSPKSGYPHQPPYQHLPDVSHPGGIEAGAPPPASALAAQEAAAERNDPRNGDNRPASVGPKRMRDWEDEPQPSMKKPASDEERARMDNMHHRRPSTPPRDAPFRRNSSEIRRPEDQRRMDERRAEDQRREEQRRANENYHPSEAAHHPPTAHLPPMQAPLGPQHPPHAPVHELPPPPPPPASAHKEYVAEDRERERERMDHPPPPPPQPVPVGEPERASRRMDVDEDYDDSGEEDKNGGMVSASGSGPASTAGEPKITSPILVNGHGANGVNGAIKAEAVA